VSGRRIAFGSFGQYSVALAVDADAVWPCPKLRSRFSFRFRLPRAAMVTLRIIRHGRHEQVLAECSSTVVPARGEVVQLDTLDERGEQSRPSTLWRVVSVTLHVPSLASSVPRDGARLAVKLVEVAVLPDVALVPDFEAAAAQILSESKM
jgi:hypothetical protein